MNNLEARREFALVSEWVLVELTGISRKGQRSAGGNKKKKEKGSSTRS
jgi:hypothetical protein